MKPTSANPELEILIGRHRENLVLYRDTEAKYKAAKKGAEDADLAMYDYIARAQAAIDRIDVIILSGKEMPDEADIELVRGVAQARRDNAIARREYSSSSEAFNAAQSKLWKTQGEIYAVLLGEPYHGRIETFMTARLTFNQSARGICAPHP